MNKRGPKKFWRVTFIVTDEPFNGDQPYDTAKVMGVFRNLKLDLESGITAEFEDAEPVDEKGNKL